MLTATLKIIKAYTVMHSILLFLISIENVIKIKLSIET